MGAYIPETLTIIGKDASSTGSYISERARDIKLLRRLVALHGDGAIEYSKSNNWVRIKGTILNGISRDDVNRYV